MGKARRFNSYDHSMSESRKTVENFGIARQSFSGITSSFASPAKGKGLSTKNNYLVSSEKGTEFNAPIGFTADTHRINASNVLDLSSSVAGTVTKVKGLIFVSSLTSSTLDEIVGKIYNGQILILTGIDGQTAITITHASGVAGQILCPGDTNYTLSDDESVVLVHDVINAIQPTWRLITSSGSAGDDLGNHTATTTLNLNSNNINNANIIYGGAGTGSTVDFGATMSLSASTNMNLSDSAGIFLNSDQSAVAVEFLRKVRPYTNNIDLGDPTHKWGDIYFQSGTGTSKIYLDGGGDTYITGSATSGRINIYNDGTNRTAFTTSGFSVLSNDVTDIGTLKFDSTGTPAAAETSISSLGGNLYYNVLATNDSHFFQINGTSEVEIDADGLDIKTGWLELFERSTPTGLSNHARLYAKDNGAGKTQLVVIFGSGAEQVIATEP